MYGELDFALPIRESDSVETDAGQPSRILQECLISLLDNLETVDFRCWKRPFHFAGPLTVICTYVEKRLQRESGESLQCGALSILGDFVVEVVICVNEASADPRHFFDDSSVSVARDQSLYWCSCASEAHNPRSS
jgi:hypothetical protein